MPEEYLQLIGWPLHTFPIHIPCRMSDSAVRRACGNAMCVPCIGAAIVAVLATTPLFPCLRQQL